MEVDWKNGKPFVCPVIVQEFQNELYLLTAFMNLTHGAVHPMVVRFRRMNITGKCLLASNLLQ